VDSARVYDAKETTYAGNAWRQIAPQHDPRSGEGARIAGGRFNPPNSFPVLYLCLSRPCASAELQRLAERQVVGLNGLLPRRLVQFEVELHTAIDLCERSTRDHLGVTFSDLVNEDRTICRAIGVAAHARGVQGLLSPSATGVDVVLALFPENLGSGRLEIVDEVVWNKPADVEQS